MKFKNQIISPTVCVCRLRNGAQFLCTHRCSNVTIYVKIKQFNAFYLHFVTCYIFSFLQTRFIPQISCFRNCYLMENPNEYYIHKHELSFLLVINVCDLSFNLQVSFLFNGVTYLSAVALHTSNLCGTQILLSFINICSFLELFVSY